MTPSRPLDLLNRGQFKSYTISFDQGASNYGPQVCLITKSSVNIEIIHFNNDV